MIIVVRLTVTFIQNSRKPLLSRADVERIDATNGKWNVVKYNKHCS